MLACAASRSDRPRLDPEEWGLRSDAVNQSAALPSATWESLYSDLIGSGRYDVLRPDFELVLRHAAGTLFQEAHIEARVSPNFWLPGLEGPVHLPAGARPTDTGVYFTPPAIARSLAEEAIRAIWNSVPSTITVFDPACGSGELLRECLRILKLRGYNGRVRIVGFDSSASSVAMARFALASEALLAAKSGRGCRPAAEFTHRTMAARREHTDHESAIPIMATNGFRNTRARHRCPGTTVKEQA